MLTMMSPGTKKVVDSPLEKFATCDRTLLTSASVHKWKFIKSRSKTKFAMQNSFVTLFVTMVT